MKRPLKLSEVPPGSVFRQETTFKPGEYVVPSSVREHGIHLLTEFFGWEDLKNSLWRILRPGEDWQPCYVEEFNPADYQPGQEVDVATARKLHEAGVKLDFSSQEIGWQPNYTAIGNSDRWMTDVKAKFRIHLPPKLRNIRPDELPEFFKVVWPDKGWTVCKREGTCPADIRRLVVHKAAWTTDLNATELNSFQVEDK